MKTQSFNSASSNLGATIKQSMSMIMGKDVSNFTLVFLDPTVNNSANSSQMFVVPNITIGRAGACHVRYGDQYTSVSRQHASITGNNNQYYLNHNPAATNPTYVNGTPISGPHLLKNGDTIQFSQNGPRARFNVSNTKTSTIGVTARVNRAMGQAIRPYRKAVAILGILLLGSIAGLGYNFFGDEGRDDAIATNKEGLEEARNSLTAEIKKASDMLEGLRSKLSATQDSLDAAKDKVGNIEDALVEEKKRSGQNSAAAAALKRKYEEALRNQQAFHHEIAKLKTIKAEGEARKESAQAGIGVLSTGDQGNSSKPTNSDYPLREFDNDIYFIKLESIIPVSGSLTDAKIREYKKDFDGLYSGTGFLTNEGKFITARHVVEGFKFFSVGENNCDMDIDNTMLSLNAIDLRGDLLMKYVATSPRGDVLKFTNKMIKFDDTEETIHQYDCEDELGNRYSGSLTRYPEFARFTDWASVDFAGRKGISSIELNRNFSTELKKGKKLEVSGYARGSALQGSSYDPLYSTATIAQDGLTDQVINVSNYGYDAGNSGGPVFAKNSNGKYQVIGIVSGSYGKVGRIVPIWYVN